MIENQNNVILMRKTKFSKQESLIK